jgi:protein phosphatase
MLRDVDELLSIGEFSHRSGLSPKRLRTYAAAGLLSPIAVDPSSGYRYYSLTQLGDARLIDALRAAGVALADIAALVQDPSPQRLDEWSRQVHVEALQRQQALEVARELLATANSPVQDLYDGRSGDHRMTTLRASERSERGRERDNNEDAVLSAGHLLVVADGMGGHRAGEVASQAAVSLIQAAYTGLSVDELQAGVRAASRSIWDRANSSPDLEGMGTTVCAAGLTAQGHLGVVHVGDSRVYLWRDGALEQLTRDHSVTAELVARGELTDAEVVDHPLRGCLTRALGVAPEVEVSSAVHELTTGDRLLLCSDGLFSELADSDIAAAMASNADTDSAVSALVKLAQARGSGDDITVVVADVCAS